MGIFQQLVLTAEFEDRQRALEEFRVEIFVVDEKV
jgi:hypothetical protein